MHSKIENTEMVVNDQAVIEELFQSLLTRYQIALEIAMKGSCFIFDHVHLLYYECHKKIKIMVDHK